MTAQLPVLLLLIINLIAAFSLARFSRLPFGSRTLLRTIPRIFAMLLFFSTTANLMLETLTTLGLPRFSAFTQSLNRATVKALLLSELIAVAICFLCLFRRGTRPSESRLISVLRLLSACFLPAFLIEALLFNSQHYTLIGSKNRNLAIPFEALRYRGEPLPSADRLTVTFDRFNHENALSFSAPISDIRNIKLSSGKRSMENVVIGMTISAHPPITEDYLQSPLIFFPDYDPNPVFNYRNSRVGEPILIHFSNAIYLSYLEITGITLNAEIPLRINPLRIILLMALFVPLRKYVAKNRSRSPQPPPLLPCGVILCFLILTAALPMDIPANILRVSMVVCLALLLTAGIAARQKQSGDEQYWLSLLFAAGLLLRLYFVRTTAWFSFQHDVTTADIEHGHIGYILYLFAHGTLPKVANWQFTHPPLYHALSAAFLKLLTALRLISIAPFEQLQFLGLLISMLILYLSQKTLTALNIRGRARLLAFSILCFHPYLIQLSGSLNNDQLLLLLTLLSAYSMIQWSTHQKRKYLAWGGFFTGLAAITKVSGLLIAPAALLMILLKARAERQTFRNLLRNGLAFGLPLLPLPLCWFIHSAVVLGIPFNHVGDLGLDSGQYIGNYSLLQRIFTVDSIQLRSFYIDPYAKHFSLPADILKSSLFDEWTHPDPVSAGLLFCANLVLILCGFLAKREIFRKDATAEQLPFLFLYTYQFLLLAFFLYFCRQYPQVCSQNFRYIIPSLWIGVLSIGAALMNDRGKTGKINTALQRICVLAILIFNLSSSAFFIINF